jgi:hypothetical protein
MRRALYILLALPATGLLPAQTTAQKIETSFRQLDRNGDGNVTREESGNANWFNIGDENRDGKLTLDEAIRRLSALVERHGVATPQIEATPPDESLKEQPQLLKPSEHGVGKRIPDLNLRDLSGNPIRPTPDSKAWAFICFGASCPLSNKFGPEMARIEKEYSTRGVTLVFVNPVTASNKTDSLEFAKKHNLTSPVVHDAEGTLLQTLRPTTTTEAFVLDSSRTLVFRGALNDQYGLGYSKPKPTRNYLRDALDAILRGESPTIPATTAPGCEIDLPTPTPGTPQSTTYHRDISRILQAHCIECHRDGGLAPFSLETHEDVIEHAAMIRRQVERGAMPPWFAAPSSHGLFANDRSLTDSDKATLLNWLRSDRPLGNPAEAPLPRIDQNGWTIGTPQVVFQIPKPVNIPAEGVMPYQVQVVETSFREERWVRGYEIVPTDPSVVHHVIVNMHPKGSKITGGGEGEGGYFAAYVPGNTGRLLPDGFAKRLPAGARLSFQIHYTPNGKATADQLTLGLIFADKPPLNEVHVAAVAHPRLNIPPHAANHVETKRQQVPFNLNVTGFMAHMHVRGKSFKYELTTPDGKTETLLDIPRYDFNWQLNYQYAQPRFIPRGSTVTITAVFDNSSNNPANPDPGKTVRWGQQTYDEMMIGYVEHFTPLAPSR